MRGAFLTSGYASPAEEGLRCWDYDTGAGSIRQRWGLRGLNSPTWLLRHPNGHILYSGEKGVGTDAEGFLVTYALEAGGARVLSRMAVGGVSPCHLSLDESSAFLSVSCYASGTLSVFRLDGTGLPVERCALVQHHGHGAHPERQEGPHIHYAACRSETVYVCDLGLDTVFRYHLDRRTGALSPAGQHFHTQPGEGPRHLAFHPSLPGCFCLLTELSGRVYVLREGAEEPETMQICPALPADYAGENTAAAIRFTADGAFLLVSHRGHDSIAVFPVRPDGTLGQAVHSSSGGAGPRDFHLQGELILSANQYDGHLAVLALDRDTCRLAPLARAAGAGQPTCVLPLRAWDEVMVMDEREILHCTHRHQWRRWLSEHFETSREVWFVFPNKDAAEAGVSYNDAVEEALCFGWIDGQAGTLDELHQLRRFTPRRPGSSYSRPNIERLIWLDGQGMLHPSVRDAVAALITTPYVFPPDILDAICADEDAWRHFQSFSAPYKRIRVAYIDAARKRPEEFAKRLAFFLKKTRENKRIMGYGGIEKYY